MSDEKQPVLSDANQQMAIYIAMVVRNAMEDFHCEHCSRKAKPPAGSVNRFGVPDLGLDFNDVRHGTPFCKMWRPKCG